MTCKAEWPRQSVPLSDINPEDHTYRITTRTDPGDLAVSIEQLGLLHPLAVKEEPSGLIVISGFRRLAACRRLGWMQIPTVRLGAELSRLDCVCYAIAENALQRPLNLVETSRCLNMLAAFFTDTQSLAAAASKLALPDNAALIKKIIGICHLPQPVQAALLTGTVTLAMALELGQWDPAVAVTVVGIFAHLKFSLNKQREFMQLVQEIAKREDRCVPDILADHRIKEILDDDNLDRTAKTQKLRRYLRRRRYPAICAAEAAFAKEIKQLTLGHGMQFIPPKDFEGTIYDLRLSFKSLSELKILEQRLAHVIRNPGLQRILDQKLNTK